MELENQKEILDALNGLNHTLYESSFTWWEKKRLPYNLVVGICGISSLLFTNPIFGLRVIIEIIIWAILLNIFYCFGFLSESFDEYYFQKSLKTEKNRIIIFVFWTIFMCVLTILANIYYDLILDFIF
jgi:hypothetical protein